MSSGLDPVSFAGVLDIIKPSRSTDQLDEEAVLDDIEGEQETIPNLEEGNVPVPHAHVTELLAMLNDVSRGVSDKTHEEYQR
jgi:hypothetical protein